MLMMRSVQVLSFSLKRPEAREIEKLPKGRRLGALAVPAYGIAAFASGRLRRVLDITRRMTLNGTRFSRCSHQGIRNTKQRVPEPR